MHDLRNAQIFWLPVDIIKYKLLDYNTIITKPMDF